MTFYIFINYDVGIKLVADNIIYIPDKDIYIFIDSNGNELMSLSGDMFKLEINFVSESVGGHIDIHTGKLVVDFENGTDADFDTHSIDIQNGDGFYNECGKYVSYHKDEL